MSRKNEGEGRRILDLLKHIEFAHPGSLNQVLWKKYQLSIQVDNVHDEMVEYYLDRFLMQGIVLQVEPEEPPYNALTFHVDLASVSPFLCGHLDSRRCWGLTRVRHWIDELSYALGDREEEPKHYT